MTFLNARFLTNSSNNFSFQLQCWKNYLFFWCQAMALSMSCDTSTNAFSLMKLGISKIRNNTSYCSKVERILTFLFACVLKTRVPFLLFPLLLLLQPSEETADISKSAAKLMLHFCLLADIMSYLLTSSYGNL